VSKYSLTHLTDGTLLRDLTALVARERANTAELLAHLAEVDARRLYVPAGYSSMHAYCEEELGFSEDAANKRIRAARRAREVPLLFAAIADGRLHLSGVILLASYLTLDNADELIRVAEKKSKAAIEALLAGRRPRSEELPMVETISAQAPSESVETVETAGAGSTPIARATRNQPAPGPVAAIPRRSRVEPIARDRYVLRACLGQATLDKLNRARSLLSHKIPNGDLSAVLDRVLDLAIESLEKRKFAATREPRKTRATRSARHVPAEVKRAIWERDRGQCTFVSDSGHRCTSRTLLEFDHVTPVARGGRASIDNLRLRCRTHNRHEAELAFGKEFMRRKRQEAIAKAEAQRQHAKQQAQEVIPYLRKLGYRADQTREAAARCEAIPDAGLEERVKIALGYLAPGAVTLRPATAQPVGGT